MYQFSNRNKHTGAANKTKCSLIGWISRSL